MLTLDQIVYNLLNAASGGRSTQNEHVSTEQIKFWIHYHRSEMLRRDLSRNRRLREFEQTIGPILFEQIREATDRKPAVWASPELPPFIRLRDAEALTFVGDALGMKSFQMVDNHSVSFRPYNKYTPSNPIAFVLQGRVHLQSPPEGEDSFMIRGIFENPEAVHRLRIQREEIPPTEPLVYPLPLDLMDQLFKRVIESEMQAIKSSPLDIAHNTLPDEKLPQPGGSS